MQVRSTPSTGSARPRASSVWLVGPASAQTGLEAACAKALVVGDPRYKTIKGILDVHAEAPLADHTATPRRTHPRSLSVPGES